MTRRAVGRAAASRTTASGAAVGRAAVGRAVAATAVALAMTVVVAAPGVAATQADGQDRRGGSLQGVWQMDGYGLVAVVSGSSLATYDVTTHSCVPGWVTGTQDGAPGRDGTVRYVLGDNALTLTPQPGGRRAIDVEEGGTGTKTLRRLDALPALCTRPAPNDPLAVFDRFWETFEENYPFFAAKGIDWHAARDEQRAKITPATTTDQLQQIFIDLLTPLKDAHTSLARVTGTGPTGVYSGRRDGSLKSTPALRDAARRAVDAQLTGPEKEFAVNAQGASRLGVGRLPDGVGYLRVSGFDGYATGGFAAQAKELDRALDALLADPDRLNGLVIDVRLNGGGSDALGQQIAARLTDRPYVAYRKVARDDPADPTKFTRPQPVVVRPACTEHFTGPVALLTSSLSISAAETFTQTLMGRSPHVVRIGENTQGVFSDVLIKTLSPDFMVVLPNEKYLTPDGSTFDGPGIPPDVRTPVFTDEELAGLKDSALSTARRVLGEQ
ncbi:S41 family peptidase [Kitasatospora sp. NPDC088264]|uniref:S41 family peptidase n=1 Tax=Kitasatospora sp. NPDC088264 TaxID=3155296 RepID=UPI003446B059